MENTGESKRINEVLRAYWDELRGVRPYPMESEIDIDALEAIWDSCFLVTHTEKGDFVYTYLGRSLIEAYGGELDEKEICERLVFPSSAPLADKFNEVIGDGVPVVEEGEMVNTRNMIVRYRSVLLPLAREGGEVGYIIGGMKWKEY